MEFRSKMDRFFALILTVTSLVILAVSLLPLVFDKSRSPFDIILVLTLCVLAVGFLWWIVCSIKYVFFQDYLLVKGGFFRSRIPYQDIIKVSPVKEVFTGYRLLSAKNGLELFYTSASLGSVKISPNERERFISELKARCPNVRVDV
ncbi:PH domain-containing protein [Bacillus massiliglaciei]|uniref:PH domain-containing protein n=1 Tax=Bacillus massiliglaciei TaxID=1816693 RepID=UPI000DA61620|nr:PH domain-containing protein [Bacillus massiliglaciei]